MDDPLPSGLDDQVPLEAVKREYNPSHRKRRRTHGFLRRLRTPGGRRVIKRRRAKGRWYVGI